MNWTRRAYSLGHFTFLLPLQTTRPFAPGWAYHRQFSHERNRPKRCGICLDGSVRASQFSLTSCTLGFTFPVVPMRVLSVLLLLGLLFVCPARGQKPELVVELGPTQRAGFVAFSPDSRMLASSNGSDSTISLWDLASRRMVRTFVDEPGIVTTCVAFSPDGRTLASGYEDGTIALWDIASGRQLLGPAVQQREEIISATFSPDGHTLASVARGYAGGHTTFTIRLWDATGGRGMRSPPPIFALDSNSPYPDVAFSHDGQTLAFTDGKKVDLWDLTRGLLPRSLGHNGVFFVAFSPDGRTLASGADDNTIKLWSVDEGGELRNFAADFQSYNAILRSSYSSFSLIAFSPDSGTLLAAGLSDHPIHRWNLESGLPLSNVAIQTARVRSLAISPDLRMVASFGTPTLSADTGDGMIVLWDLESGREIGRLVGHAKSVDAVAISRDGKMLASGNWGPTIKLWNLTSKQIDNLAGSASSVAFSFDGRMLASGFADGTIKLWDVETKREVRTLPHYASRVFELAFTPDGKTLVSSVEVGAMQTLVLLWDVKTGGLLRRLYDHTPEWAFAVSRDGRMLASQGRGRGVQRSIALWNVATGHVLRRYNNAYPFEGLAFSPDGKTLAWADDYRDITLLDLASGHNLSSLRCGRAIRAMAFSPDGETLIAGCRDPEAIRAWDVAIRREPHEVRRLIGHTQDITGVTFSADGRFIISGSWDGTVRIWNAASGDQLATLVALDESDWAVVDPEGRFDTNDLDGGLPLHWLVPDDPMHISPLEIFMHDYYTPGLLATIMKGQQDKLPPVRSIAEITNRVQPDVSVVSVTASATPGQVDVTVHAASHIEAKRDAQGNLRKDGSGSTSIQASGLQDLRLFRDGQLVGSGYADVSATCAGAGTHARRVTGGYVEGALKDCDYTFHDVPLKSGATKISFTAYAFNSERIKSATASLDYEPAPRPTVKPRAYLLQIGVNHYAARGCELSYSVNDAEKMSAELSERLAAQGYDVQPVKLESVMGGSTLAAGKQAIRDHLAAIAAQATPDDVFFMSFSGHGYSAEGGEFYILPSDIQGSCREVNKGLLKSAISADELAAWLRPIDAGQMTLILDACFSAESVQSGDFKPGPLGSKGLGQLAYDKRMRILAASQSDEVAHEYDSLHQGLLTYVLTHDGLDEGKAAKDGKITVGGWLAYGTDAVPKFALPSASNGAAPKAAGERFANSSSSRTIQVPALFDFSKTDILRLQ